MGIVTAVAAFGAVPEAQAPTPDQRVAALKQHLQDDRKALGAYEWIETTIISVKGEEKARKQQRCYYGADGTVQKIAMGEPAAAAKQAPGGRRGERLKKRVVENKKEDMQDYMERAAALIHRYVPPDPARIQAAKDAGKLAVTPSGSGRVRLAFTDYLQAADSLAFEIDMASNRLAAVAIATWLEKREDAVTLDVRYGALQDGTGFAAQTQLDATAENIRVVIQNSGHRPLAK
jgi:hypothetical protein